ncbi:MAG: hypothetical protein ISS26_00030 [Candidatus Omnitrophica bacterium]|nr:hypothetical protein [Candidatus Omnitrophota bacterium]
MRNNSKIFTDLLAGLIGFGINAAYAITYHWSLQEFCWSTWLAALFLSWTCIAVDSARIILTFRVQKETLELKIPSLKKVSSAAFLVLICLVVLAVAWIIFHLYSYLFGFYGIFLSVFAEMEPHSFFGRNGFINSDFFSPVMYLLTRFWPMIMGLLIANLNLFLKGTAWRLMFLPFRSGVIIRIHFMVLVMPFLCLLAWAISKNDYQPITIILLMGIFYLLPTQKTISK